MSDESGSALDPDKIPRRRGLHIRDIKEEAPEPAQTVGSELKAAREAAGKELHEVAAALRIKPEHLVALEAAEYDRLPAKTYVVGFVRQYAQHVGLNAAEMVERLKAELDGPPAEAPAARKAEPVRRTAGPVRGPVKGPVTPGNRPGQAEEDSSRLPTLSIAVVVVLLLVVIFGGWYLTRPSGDGNSSADKKTETSDVRPRVRSDGEMGGGLPRPPLVPASGGEAGAGTAERGSGSLTVLLPGADRIGAGAEAVPAGDAPAPSTMPDAAALAVPIENSGAGGEGGADTPDRPRGEAVVAEAMPRPNMQVKTVPSHLPGLPESEGGAGAAEPALTEIEAEGVGGEGEAGDAPAPAVQPRPKQLARGAGEYGASAVRSRVTLRVRSSTWVRVEDADGRIIIERDMRSGDSFRAPDIDGLYLVTKDAGAIELYLDGESIGRAGRPKQVLTGLQLAPEKLRQHVAQNTGPEIR